jgi:hypothetical protein
MTAGTRPAFYALASGGWRDYVTLLHPPYTLWHLSYVAAGAGLAPVLDWGRLGLLLLAFFLAVGIGAHALDELMGRPLQTRIPGALLVALAAVSIGGAVAIGVYGAVEWNLWLLAFVAFGGFVVVAYNLELFRGLFHDSVWFGLAWGAFPALTAYFTMAERIRAEAVLAAAYGFFLSFAQRRLSTVVRTVRRRVSAVSGTIERTDGTTEQIDAETLIEAPERALQLMTAATVALGLALVLVHV